MACIEHVDLLPTTPTLSICPRASCLAFSFNGGKDSTVLLHILRAALCDDQQLSNGSGAAGRGNRVDWPRMPSSHGTTVLWSLQEAWAAS